MAINGTTGNDTLTGTKGDDTIYGLAGNDSITGDDGNDYLDGGSGNDTVDGGVGNDTIFGGAGSDSLIGGDGDDKLYKYAESGSSFLSGGAGADTIQGGLGNDTIDGGTGDDAWLEGYAGNDSILGGDGNDKLYGDEGGDTLDGGTGNDYLDGGDGNDTLDGGAGNDSLTGGAGNDLIYGGAGDDKINYVDDSGNDTVYGGDGNDFISYTSVTGDKIFYGEGGNDSFYGGVGNDSIDGGADNDYLTGGAGDDKLIGGGGNDSLYGDGGNDTLDGGSGVNLLFGGDGNDTYYIRNKTDYVYDSGGTDTAYVSASFVKIPSTIEKVIYTDGALALPYWIGALLPDSASGLNFNTLLGGTNIFRYAFPKTLPTYDTSNSDANGFSPFTATQIASTKAALTYISSLLNITFQETSNTDQPNTLIFANNKQTNSGGYAEFPSANSYGSDVFLNIADYNTTLAEGTYGSLVLMHEVGHALGLKHPFSHQQAGEGGVAEGPYLTGNEESSTWTVMSYDSSPSQYLLNYQPLDIAALQYLYGPSPTARATDDTYQISSSTSNFIWDGSGNDAISLVNLNQGATIYLTPGYWGYVGTKSSQITAAGQVTVNFGSIIERLFGSAYSDSLYGNEVNNTIDGGAGNDLIEGWTGNDSLIGGLGNDTLNGGVGNDYLDGGDGADVAIFTGKFADYKIQYDSLSGRYTFNDGVGVDGTDTIINVETAQFADKSITLSSLDFTPPTIALTINKTLLGVGQTATLTFTLSEPSTNFVASDVTVSGGTLSNFTGSGTSYTATFTPAANSATNCVVSVASGVFTDAAGNANVDGSDANNTVTFAVDTLIPTIAVTSSKSSLIAGDTATLTFTLSEPSTNFVASDVTVSGGTLSNFTGSGTSYTAIFTPTANSTSAVVSVVSGVFTDAAGNTNADGSDSNNRVIFAVTTLGKSISGTASNDNLIGSTGNDTIDGGAGIDTVSYSANRSAYTIVRLNSSFSVSSAADGVDTLANVERLKFSDSNLALDLGVNQSAGQTALLIGAVLPGKLALDPSKQGLLGSVIGLFDLGYSTADLSGALLRLDIWPILTGQNIKAAGRTLAENTAIVNYLMTNVNGVAPDAATLKSNADVMNGEPFQGAWLAQLALSTAGQSHIGLVGLASTGLIFT
jgi:serralysin